MLNNTWSRHGFHNIDIECIRLEQPAVHYICDPLNGHLMHYNSVEYCPILRAKPCGVRSDFFVIFRRLYIHCFSISQTCSTGDMNSDNPYQECHPTLKYSCRCLAVKHWSINALLAFNQATPNSIWLNTCLK